MTGDKMMTNLPHRLDDNLPVQWAHSGLPVTVGEARKLLRMLYPKWSDQDIELEVFRRHRLYRRRTNVYEWAEKEIFELREHFRSKHELIEALAVRNPEWVQFADRLWGELLVRHEEAVAMLGTIEDGPLIRGTWACEIGGVVKLYFALMDDEEIEDYAEWLVDDLAHLRKWVDCDGNALWDGIEPLVWRPATQDEYDEYSRDPIDHLVCGVGLPTAPWRLN